MVFVGKREMRQINAQYRHRNYPTDVLSFDYDGMILDGVPLLGEILVAPAVAEYNARSCRSTVGMEVKKLLVHGILHLSGHDHETDDGRMRRLQASLMRRAFVQQTSAVVSPQSENLDHVKACS